MLTAVHASWQNEQCPCQIILRRKSTTSTCESAFDVKSHSKHKAVLARAVEFKWLRSISAGDDDSEAIPLKITSKRHHKKSVRSGLLLAMNLSQQRQ